MFPVAAQQWGGVLDRISFRSFIFLGFVAWAALFWSCHSISAAMRSGLWLGDSKTNNFSSLRTILLLIYLYVLGCRLVTSIHLELASDDRSFPVKISLYSFYIHRSLSDCNLSGPKTASMLYSCALMEVLFAYLLWLQQRSNHVN